MSTDCAHKPSLTISSTCVLRHRHREYSTATKKAFTRISAGMASKPKRFKAYSSRPGSGSYVAGTTPSDADTVHLPDGRAVFLQPGEDFLVPIFAVFRLEHPVALVREVDEPRRNSQALQR